MSTTTTRPAWRGQAIALLGDALGRAGQARIA